jgi:HD superfamily phosphodiesterase
MEEFLKGLIAELVALYAPEINGYGGHDWTHPRRMELMAGEIQEFLEFDRHEFIASVWLHNMDHSPSLKKLIQAQTLKGAVRSLLASSPFSTEAIERIADAVDEHWVKDDRPGDSGLRRALRLADKWDRVGMIGTTCSAAFLGSKILPYDPRKPFGYDNASLAGYEQSCFSNTFKIIEWYRMYPLVRSMAGKHPRRMHKLIRFVRDWAEEIAETHGVENLVEDDLKKALGEFYEKFL